MDYFSQHIFSDPEKKTLDYNIIIITFGFFKISLENTLIIILSLQYRNCYPLHKNHMRWSSKSYIIIMSSKSSYQFQLFRSV